MIALPAYELVKGTSGNGLNDFYGPEINSKVVGLPSVAGCEVVNDPSATGAWTKSPRNEKFYF